LIIFTAAMKKPKKQSQKVKQKSKDLFDRWNHAATIRKGDIPPVILKKLGIRILGIILLIIFSPILLAIFILVVAVSL
jgi:lipopolysaccharide/colanic/teichoic acid biosynthesis glycosyltransferase